MFSKKQEIGIDNSLNLVKFSFRRTLCQRERAKGLA